MNRPHASHLLQFVDVTGSPGGHIHSLTDAESTPKRRYRALLLRLRRAYSEYEPAMRLKPFLRQVVVIVKALHRAWHAIAGHKNIDVEVTGEHWTAICDCGFSFHVQHFTMANIGSRPR
jgi:hypothetical protein